MQRKLFPCCFGAALRLDGVEEFLSVLDRYAPCPVYGDAFAARVYKVGRDQQGKRLTYLKVTGGTLRVKQVLSGGSGEDAWEEKIDQIRIYSGTKFEAVDEVCAGSVCAQESASTDQKIGTEADLIAEEAELAGEPVLSKERPSAVSLR